MSTFGRDIRPKTGVDTRCARSAPSLRQNTPERLAVFLAAEREKWDAIIRKAHIRLE